MDFVDLAVLDEARTLLVLRFEVRLSELLRRVPTFLEPLLPPVMRTGRYNTMSVPRAKLDPDFTSFQDATSAVVTW